MRAREPALGFGRRWSRGSGLHVNLDAVMLDVVPITIGAACQIASRVQHGRRSGRRAGSCRT